MAREMKYSGVKWIGEIPHGWKLVKVKYVSNIASGTTPASNIEDYWDGEIRWITPADFKTSEKWIKTGRRNITEKGRQASHLTIFPTSSVIFSKRAPIGQVGITTEKLCINQGCLGCITNEIISPTILYYLLSVFTEQFELLGSGTTFKEISATKFASFSIPLPPLSEQQAIADFLDGKCGEIEGLLADLDAEVKTLAEYKKSIIAETVTRGLNPNAPMKAISLGWIDVIPEHWVVARIASLYSVRNEKVSDKDYQPLSVTMKGIVPQLESAAKTKHGDDRKLIRKGDFVINSRSDRRGSCGISTYEGSCSLINTVLAPREEMNPRYYNWLFHTSSFADEFYKWGYGIVDDLWTTNWGAMRRIQIPIPPFDEQEKIASYLDKKIPQIEETIADKQTQIEALKSYKASLIYEYVTGKKQVI